VTAGRAAARLAAPLLLGARRPGAFLERNIAGARHAWLVLVSGFFEALFFLLAIGVGVGGLVGTVSVGGVDVRYEDFVAPAMLAASAMNGAIFETTGNIFFRFRYSKIYEAALNTPVSPRDIAAAELLWALARGGAYALGFVIVMAALGYTSSPWAVLLLPGAILIGAAFGAAGLAVVTIMRSWADLEIVQLAVLPLFLFSATFVPLSQYPGWAQWIVRVTPLYQGVELLRDLALGTVGAGDLAHVAYLVAMTAAGLAVAGGRFEKLLQR